MNMAEVIKGKTVANVAEAWPIYDTLCVTPQFYGSESIGLGWFNTFAAFAAKEQHSFFMNRTLGQIGMQYTNKSTVDRVDFAYDAFSIGVRFFSPGVRTLGVLEGGELLYRDNYSAHWWETELPSHCTLQLKTQQDIVAEGPAMMFSPGYGVHGNGASFEHEEVPLNYPNGDPLNVPHPPVMNWAVTQGIPVLSNRFDFGEPIGIPRTGSIEAILHISEYAREILTSMGSGVGAGNGPYNYVAMDPDDIGDYIEFPSRYGIQVSLMGVRYVQQRAQYHA